MSARIDITGQRFGRLIAIDLTSERNVRGLVVWNCLCDCGRKCVVNGNHLRTGHTTSCGCLEKECSAAKGKEQIPCLEGKKLGRLFVVKQTSKRLLGNVLWKCQCDCGNVALVTSGRLKSGNSRSCGCLQEANRFTKGTNIDPMDVPFEITRCMQARREVARAIKQVS